MGQFSGILIFFTVDSQENTLVEGFDSTSAKLTEVEETFVLEPVERASKKRRKNIKRGKNSKRRLKVDEEKELNGELINSQLDDFTDLLQPKCFAPRTKKGMKQKGTTGCDHLYSRPAFPSLGVELGDLIMQNYSVDIPEDPVTEAWDTDGVTRDETTEVELWDDADVTDSTDTDVTKASPHDTKASPHDTKASPHDTKALPHDDTKALPHDDTKALPHDDTKALPQSVLQDDTDTHGNTDASETVPHDSSGAAVSDCDVDGQPFSGGEQRDDTSFEAIVSDFNEVQQYKEEYELRQWTKTTQQVLHLLQRNLSTTDEVYFSSLSFNCNRKQAVSRFATCLLLVKEGIITVTQSEPYGDIELQKGPKFL